MKSLKNLNSSVLIFLFFVSCGQSNNNNSVANNKIGPDSVKIIDIDKCDNVKADFDIIFRTHKNFDKVGEIDTLRISDGLISVKKAKYRINDTCECFNSDLTIYYRNRKVFFKDSIATSGMYYYDAEKELLAIPVITYQDRENFQTFTKIYLCNLKNGVVRIIGKDLINSSFVLIYHNGEKMVYTSADKLLVYDIKRNKENTILNFDNPLMAVFRLAITNDSLEIYYFKDFTNDLLNNNSMRKAKFKLNDKF